MDRDALQLLLAQGVSVEQIGRRFGRHPSTVSYWMRKHGLEAPNRAKHAGKGGIGRAELEEAVQTGLSIAEIARRFGRSKGTVRHWLGRYGLKTMHRSKRSSSPDAIAARDAALGSCVLPCPRHGDTKFVREGGGYYRCVRCRVESVAKHRGRLKDLLVAEAGGRCLICGYDRHPRALEFHHIDPGAKAFALSQRGVTLSLESMRSEARKCVLLCSNCHAEVEAGVVALPLHLAGRAVGSRDTPKVVGSLHHDPG
jgi:transposase